MVSTGPVSEHADARGRRLTTALNNVGEPSTAVFVLTEADMQDVQDAISGLIAESQQATLFEEPVLAAA